jgi:putative transposase
MPDHVHFLLEGKTETSDLHVFVARFKQKTGYLFRMELGRDLWQERYYDHTLRQAADSEDVAWYIWMNPIRKGLITEPSQYPFSGSFTVDWPKNPKKEPPWRPPWKNPLAST